VATSSRASNARYLVLAILTVTQMGSSLMSQGIGSLAPFIADTLSLNRTQIGLLTGALGLGWMLTSPLAGVIVDRFGERRVILLSGLAMSLVLLGCAAMANYIWLLCWLVPYAVLMCFQTPAGGRAIMQWFTRDRGLAMGIRQMGVPIGGFVGAILLAPIAARAGYRASFVAAAGIVLVTSCLIVFLRAHPEEVPSHGGRFRLLWTGMRAIARDRRCVLMSLTQMDYNAGQSCMVSFLTITLISTAHLDLASAVFAFALSQIGSIAGRFVWGFLSDFVWDGDRMLPPICAGAIASLAALFMAIHYPEPTFQVKLWLNVAAFVLGISIAGCNGIFAMAQTEVAGLEFAGSALGVSAQRSAIASAIAPPLFGLLADTHGFSAAWVTVAVIVALGIVPAVAARRLLRESNPRVHAAR
jgi:MFS transporter, ACS family, hexuronate transporter